MSEKELSNKEKVAALISSLNRKKGFKDKVELGFGDEVDLSYGYIKAPIESLSALLSRPGDLEGGFPRGTYTVIGGPERSGKSTLCWQTIALNHHEDPDSIWALVCPEPPDERYMQMLGIDLSRLVIIRDGIMEDVMQRIIDLAKLNAITGFVVDSIGALTPKGEVQSAKGKEHELEHTGMLDLQRKMGQFFRMSSTFVKKSKAACILISHVYQDPNNSGAYVVKGGNAVKHHAHIRLKMSRVQDKSTEAEIVLPDGNVSSVMRGHDVVIKLDKTKQNDKEHQYIIVPYRLGIGFDATESTIAMGVNLGVIQQAGAWYTFVDASGEEHQVQGRNKLSDIFSNEELYNQLIHKIQSLKSKRKDENNEVISNESEV